MLRRLGLLAAVMMIALAAAGPARAQRLDGPDSTYSGQEIIDAGHIFFGRLTQGFAQAVERLVSQYGQPNGYILGEEGSGAFIGGLRYGEGLLYTRNAGNHRVYWQGPSIGFDAGGEGTRTMILV